MVDITHHIPTYSDIISLQICVTDVHSNPMEYVELVKYLAVDLYNDRTEDRELIKL